MIEHNLDLIAEADFVIDISPEAGSGGGTIVASGSPENLLEADGSATAEFLREHLQGESEAG